MSDPAHAIKVKVSELGEGDNQQMVNYYAELIDIAVTCPGFVERALAHLQVPPSLSLSAAATSPKTPPSTPKPSPSRHPPTPNRPLSSPTYGFTRRKRRTLRRRKNL